MTAQPDSQPGTWPWAPHRCPWCTRRDTIPMPPQHLLDKLIQCFWLSPFKCRACKAKFYRRTSTIPQRPRVEAVPVPDVSRCHRDPVLTLRRVEQIIQVAECGRSRKG